jgi:hypothetical protein
LSVRADVLKSGLQQLISQGISPTSPALKKMAADYKIAADAALINKSATDALNSGLAQLGSGLLQGLGQLAAGTATLGEFGATVLGLVGKLATQLGEAIVAVGIGMLGLKTAFSNPFTAIAAGAALIAVGAALGSISSSLSSVGNGGASSSGSSPTPRNYGQNSSPQKVEVVAALTLRGPDLTAVLRGDTYRVKLTG